MRRQSEISLSLHLCVRVFNYTHVRCKRVKQTDFLKNPSHQAKKERAEDSTYGQLLG